MIEYTSISTVSEIETNLLKHEGKNLSNFDYQLQTNSAYIYRLENGQIILLPNDLQDESLGIIFHNDTCFNYYLEKDSFPVDNPEKTLLEEAKKDLKSLTLNIDKFQSFLNEKTNLSLKDITLSSIEEYYKNIINTKGKRKKNLLLQETYVAMGILIGEYLRKSKNGKWGLLKQYGTYNPYYEPIIIDENQGVYMIYSSYQRFMGKFESIKFLFNFGTMQQPTGNVNILQKVKGDDYIIIFE